MEKLQRNREISIDSLPEEQAELIGEEIGKRVGMIGDEAAAKINEIMKIYGLYAKIAVQLFDSKTGKNIL